MEGVTLDDDSISHQRDRLLLAVVEIGLGRLESDQVIGSACSKQKTGDQRCSQFLCAFKEWYLGGMPQRSSDPYRSGDPGIHMKSIFTVFPSIRYALWYTIHRSRLQDRRLYTCVVCWISLREGNILHPSSDHVLKTNDLVRKNVDGME